MEDYWVWTIALSQWRYARDLRIPIIDITLESGIKAFAPALENLQAYRQGLITKQVYAQKYYDKVLASFQENLKDWQALEDHHEIAFACYCRAGDFCHRHLFSPLYINYLQSRSHSVLFQGELKSHINNAHLYQS